MAGRDRLLEGLGTVHQSVRSYIDQRTRQPATPTTSHHGTTQPAPPPPPQPLAPPLPSHDNNEPLPTYATRPPPDNQPVPERVLRAPPGQAQNALDAMPRNRLLRAAHLGDARAARNAALELHREAQQTQAAGAAAAQQAQELKRVHTFATPNGRVILDLHTPPQRNPTYMGGTRERGSGAMAGKVTLHHHEGERVTALRVKIKATARVLIPKASTPHLPAPLAQLQTQTEPSSQTEELLLQLESQLYRSESKEGVDLAPGVHAWSFRIELPATTRDGTPLPPSFVLAEDAEAADNARRAAAQGRPWPPPSAAAASEGKGKAAWDALQTRLAGLPLVGNPREWAQVKYYVKVTVERPGVLRANERVFAPFVYLPPPPARVVRPPPPAATTTVGMRRVRGRGGSARSELETVARLGWEVKAAMDAAAASPSSSVDGATLASFCIPLAAWREARLGSPSETGGPAARRANGGGGTGSGGLLSRLWKGTAAVEARAGHDDEDDDDDDGGAGSRGGERWSLLLPPAARGAAGGSGATTTPTCYPLRGCVPFVLRREIACRSGQDLDLARGDAAHPGAVPAVSLQQRAHLYSGASRHPGSAFYARPVSRPFLHLPPTPLAPTRGHAAANAAGRAETAARTRLEQYYLGAIDLPPSCAPSFDAGVVRLEYCVVVRASATAPPPPSSQPLVGTTKMRSAKQTQVAQQASGAVRQQWPTPSSSSVVVVVPIEVCCAPPPSSTPPTPPSASPAPAAAPSASVPSSSAATSSSSAAAAAARAGHSRHVSSSAKASSTVATAAVGGGDAACQGHARANSGHGGHGDDDYDVEEDDEDRWTVAEDGTGLGLGGGGGGHAVGPGVVVATGASGTATTSSGVGVRVGGGTAPLGLPPSYFEATGWSGEDD